MLRSVFPQDILAELNRLQRDTGTADEGSGSTAASGLAPGIREGRSTRFPALNLRTSPMAIEIEAFMPGVDTSDLQLAVEGDVLVLSGERTAALPAPDDGATVHTAERFNGRFRRVIGLPPDIDAPGIEARYALGVLTITVPRLQPALARPIAIQDTPDVLVSSGKLQ
jgi:HSP20 family protein